MFSRRSFLNATLGASAGAALTAPLSQPAAAQAGATVGQAPAQRPRRIIVDSQVHLWLPQSPTGPWPADGPARAHLPYPFTYDKLLPLMDEAGVDRVVIVPPSWEGERNDYALEAAENIRTASASWDASRSTIRATPNCCRRGATSPACSASG